MRQIEGAVLKIFLISTILIVKTSCEPDSINLKEEKTSNLYQFENSITGTHDVTEEERYMEKCSILKCSTGCCEGSLLEMTCGTLESCKYYISKEILIKVIYGAVISIVSLITVLLMLSGAYAKSHPERSRKFLKLIVIILSILFFPLVIPFRFIKIKCNNAKEIQIYKGEPQIDSKESSFKLEIKKLDMIKILNQEEEDGLATKRTQDTDHVVINM
jgi:hypothetical protein